ncbi:MAG: hypothetical protein NT154_14000, partial [Verrucomicrobia bacterium]|nr:hypothetical protein [Verrucomicrobiota bacterium]
MKNTSVLVGALVIGLSVLSFNGLGRAGEPPSPATKEAVSKLLAAHHFTPPIAVEGPNGSVYYVGCQPGSDSAVQAIVRVRSGNVFSVELAAFQREGPGNPWTPSTKVPVAA